MDKKIVLKTDAAAIKGQGVGLGYSAVVHKGYGKTERIEGSRYLSKDVKTTKAETIAAAFGVKEIYEEVADESQLYKLRIRVDCEQTIRDVNKNSETDKHTRSLLFFAEQFKDMEIQGINREFNDADGVAGNALEKGFRNR